jgi:ferredoxin
MLGLYSAASTMPWACRRACGAPSSSGRAPSASPPATSRAAAGAGARRRPISSFPCRAAARPETAEADASPAPAPSSSPPPQQQRRRQAPRSPLPAGPGVALGPISLSFGGDGGVGSRESNAAADDALDGGGDADAPPPESIARMTTAEWRALHERDDGTVDLWLEDEFNAGSRLEGGRAAHWGDAAGFGSGEGPTAGDAPLHRVVIRDPHYGNATFDIQVPEDRYVLFEAEAQGLALPYACRMGCCTACAVRVLEGALEQPQALGVSAELRAQGYALMCVAYPTADCVVETVSEDEIYERQFGAAFAAQALDPANAAFVARDDFALEVALGDE